MFVGLTCLLVWPAAAPAREFWEAKDPGSWTPAEIRKLTTQSPWAITGRMQPPSDPMSQMGTFLPGTGTRDSISAGQRGIGNNPGASVAGAVMPNLRTQNAPGVAFYGETTIRWRAPLLWPR
jgi:hypothetical protein